MLDEYGWRDGTWESWMWDSPERQWQGGPWWPPRTPGDWIPYGRCPLELIEALDFGEAELLSIKGRLKIDRFGEHRIDRSAPSSRETTSS